MRKVIYTIAIIFILALGTSSCTSNSSTLEEVMEDTQFDSSPSSTTDDKEENNGAPGK